MSTVSCDVLGKVTIEHLRLSQRFSLNEDADPNLLVAQILHMSVVDDKGEPLKTQKEWDVFGGRNFQAAMSLFQECMALNDFDGSQSAKK